jgi:hypothetical protein
LKAPIINDPKSIEIECTKPQIKKSLKKPSNSIALKIITKNEIEIRKSKIFPELKITFTESNVQTSGLTLKAILL